MTHEILNKQGEKLDYSFDHGTRENVLVVLGHGVTGNKDRAHLVAIASGLAERGWPCLRFSFSGNGDSDGNFEDSCITKEIGDLQSVLDSIPRDVRICYVGHSMGGAVGVLTAARDLRIQALVSLAGMTYTRDFVAAEFGDVTPGSGFMWDKPDCPLSAGFVDDLYRISDTLDAAGALIQPWLLIHGDADDVVPPKDGLAAFDAASQDKEWLAIPGADHLFDEASYPLLVAAIDDWLTRHVGSK